MQIHFRQFVPLLFTLLLHGAFVLLIFIGFSQHPVSLPTLQEITVSLITPSAPAPAPPAPPTVTPRAEPPKPKASVQPAPVARTPEPAITPPARPPAEKPAEATPTPAPPSQPAKAAASESAAVTPARFDAAYLNNPKPAYPPLSRRLNEEGRVVLRVQISAGGTATDVTLHTSSGFPRLDNAAIEAVRQWRFVPATQGGQAVPSTALVPMPFELNK